MTALSFQAARFPIRDDIRAVLPRVWSRIGEPGTWLTGAQRVAIALEARHAAACRLCAERKAALSPSAVDGVHDSLGGLPETWVDVIHRVISDPGRLARNWYRKVTDEGISEQDYVELVGVVVTVVAVDTFCRGIDMAVPAIPGRGRASRRGKRPTGSNTNWPGCRRWTRLSTGRCNGNSIPAAPRISGARSPPCRRPRGISGRWPTCSISAVPRCATSPMNTGRSPMRRSNWWRAVSRR